jgi:hypothetical protein
MENGILSTQRKKLRPVVWCFNAQWCTNEARKSGSSHGRQLIDLRNNDEFRNDKTFISLFQLKTSKATPLSLVLPTDEHDTFDAAAVQQDCSMFGHDAIRLAVSRAFLSVRSGRSEQHYGDDHIGCHGGAHQCPRFGGVVQDAA